MAEHSARILVVDDEVSLLKMLERGLGRASYECATARNAQQAAQMLEQEAFDLVLLDIGMPGKSGMELLSEITSRFSDVAVVILSGVVDSTTEVRAMQEGAYDYLTKPIGLDDLLEKVQEVLRRKEVRLLDKCYRTAQNTDSGVLSSRCHVKSLAEPWG